LHMGHRFIFSFGKMVLTAAALMAFMLLGGAPRAFADDCQKRISKADRNLHRAAERHGWESPEAEHWRHELREARAWCWEHRHRWWDEDGRRWREDRDWDDHDHDRH
jgi:hypothetical protein